MTTMLVSFFDNNDANANIDAEVGDLMRFPEPTAQDDTNFNQLNVKELCCLPMFAFSAAIFSNDFLFMDFPMIVDLVELQMVGLVKKIFFWQSTSDCKIDFDNLKWGSRKKLLTTTT